MKLALSTCAGLFVLAVLLGLAQLWFLPFSPEVFFKLEASLGGLLLIVGVVWFAVREVRDDRATREGRLDGP
jgi:uncharacterized membrane protein YgdD (TMEM256/DUF423 family)